MHRSPIAEMKTGEGKTLVATLSLHLNALSGRGTHLITVNDYLARRDARCVITSYSIHYTKLYEDFMLLPFYNLHSDSTHIFTNLNFNIQILAIMNCLVSR